MSRKTKQAEAYWREFLLHSGVDANEHAVCSFGDSPAMASELADLVVVGTKRATASLARDYPTGREPLPKVGDYVVVVDGEGTPYCVWRGHYCLGPGHSRQRWPGPATMPRPVCPIADTSHPTGAHAVILIR